MDDRVRRTLYATIWTVLTDRQAVTFPALATAKTIKNDAFGWETDRGTARAKRRDAVDFYTRGYRLKNRRLRLSQRDNVR